MLLFIAAPPLGEIDNFNAIAVYLTIKKTNI